MLRMQVHEPHDSSMGTSKQDRQFAEVLVKRDDYLFLYGRRGQYTFVTRVVVPVADPLDVVTVRAQRRHGSTPHAGIEKDLHERADSTSAGSMRSFPTILRA